MKRLNCPIASPFESKGIITIAGKLKHLALNTPLQFGEQAPKTHSWSTTHFGGLSHHSLGRNLHPHRVTHIQDLNSVLITVNEEWSKLNIPCPHPMIKSHLQTSVLGVQMPIGDPQPFPVPMLSVGSLSDDWREELKKLAASLRAASSTKTKKKRENFQRKTQYLEETGHLVPPSFQATTRHSPHRMNRNKGQNKGKTATLPFQDQELIILELLCQILQTDSLTTTQQWLLAIDQKEHDGTAEILQIRLYLNEKQNS